MGDERRFNYRKGPSLQHKIRVIAGTKMDPVQFGITVPEFIAQRFSGCNLRLWASGTTIIMESGTKLTPKDIIEMREGLEIGGGKTEWIK